MVGEERWFLEGESDPLFRHRGGLNTLNLFQPVLKAELDSVNVLLLQRVHVCNDISGHFDLLNKSGQPLVAWEDVLEYLPPVLAYRYRRQVP